MTQPNKIKAPSIFYRFLFPVWFVFWLIHAFFHAYKYRQWEYVPQRLGIVTSFKPNSIYIHAASVGEVNLMKPLCEQLIAQGNSLIISTFTATGFLRANSLFSKQARIIIMPMDCWPISSLFAKRLKVQCALIAETELWPETLYQIAKTKTPLIHINARLSDKSLKALTVIKSLLKQTLSYFNAHLTRYESDVDNFIAMGVEKNKIQVMGNLKYAQTHSIDSYPNIIQRPYILFASTHENEEVQFASLFLNEELLDDHFKAPLIVIAPRHPTRLESIIKALKNKGFDNSEIAIRSLNQAITDKTKIYLADTLGEMNSLFQHALIVTMGGSFVNVGGHNVLEPAALGACIITGPSDSNIKQDIIDLKEQDAILKVETLEQLKIAILNFLGHEKRRATLGQNATHFIKNSQQVLNNYLTAVNQFISRQ